LGKGHQPAPVETGLGTFSTLKTFFVKKKQQFGTFSDVCQIFA